MLFEIISGLKDMHKQELIHCDFHDGNILCGNMSKIYINDLGLCKPAKSFLKKYDIYAWGNSYTPASDIYSFSMIMWEFTSGIPPFNNRSHDIQLCLSICEGERPEIIENTPQCYVELMKKCWDENPLKRPSSKEVLNIIDKWIDTPCKINKELKYNIMEFINAPIGHNNNLAARSHSQAYYTSRLFDFTSKQLNKILENSQASVKVNETLVSEDLNDCIIEDIKSLDIKTDKK
ncbi:kinase-like domain-containing protein [Rhizophagus irregularis DAOM 181602=DAOM 197198]|uniref:Kinase-like domain-containing protein n=1 Tax=Rhizophagus irregularis (strain DAOM 181602 / DAOM 197198 / MUCL 43194) TaxID=747089 RepID=A0A2P4QPC7_RHIID|nr:kinase-like domain-containing protein [Rhizophagus irregularis DAOM 181602=DAOM 197198]POG79511.1 kinase-like domain-containing protein [Rhizophagus irregularis DAOM 181602=DAOM 197198]|eukprot:XP_025186377.1 kinase-like domain-containing protein [Rhizophagus irregularis DAOM 181602=DAOM 197198]